MPLGWKLRKPAELKLASAGRSAPVTTTSKSGTAEQEFLAAPAMYAAQALRYSRSDLVYMCVNRVAEMVAMHTENLHLFDASSKKDPVTGLPETEIETHPFLELWEAPNPWMSAFELMESWAITLQLNGNVYWHFDDGAEPENEGEWKVVDRRKPPTGIWPINPEYIAPVQGKEELIQYYKYDHGGVKIKFLPNSIRHFKRYHPGAELVGLSPIEAANYASASDIAAQRSNLALFKNSMKLSGVIESDRDEVDIDQLNLMKREILSTYTGDPDKAHQLAFLWSDFKYREVGMTMRDAEFIEGARLNRMRIFGVFGVHPGIVLSEDVNRANAQVGEYVTLKFTVAPMLRRFASTLSPILSSWNMQQKIKSQKIKAVFVDVVPRDKELDAKVRNLEANTAHTLIQALGPDEGVEEAKRLGILSEDVDAANAQPASAQASRFGEYMDPKEKDKPKDGKDPKDMGNR